MSTLDESIAQDVALARLKLEAAAVEHQQAMSDARTLQQRISNLEARRAEITDSRLAGKGTTNEANEFVALGADLDALRQMHTEAAAKAQALDPKVQREDLRLAEQHWQRHVTEQKYEALAAKTRACEETFLKLLELTYEAGKPLGKRTLGDAFQFSTGLSTAVRYNTLNFS